MNGVTVSQVKNLERGSALARAFTTFLMLTAVAGVLFATYSILHAPGSPQTKFTIGHFTVTADAVQSGGMKAWLLVNFWAMFALIMVCLWVVRRLFGNLARGQIFTADNVAHLRTLSWLIVGFGVYGILGPLVIAAVVTVFQHDAVLAMTRQVRVFSLTPFAAGGLLMLASWIMAVGLGVREDADALRRDSELTI